MTLVTGTAVTKSETDAMRQALQNKDAKVLKFIKVLSENHGNLTDDFYQKTALAFVMSVGEVKKFIAVLNTTGYEN
ncbi:hypothetical protein EQG49_04650 [Periweissella cryptocerci]|uniref:Uncharacterized protein n=1 Tax=Periweissella cryptocerci TaxID=2506420 RepID=A0A4P6YSV1_9LACO|nr:hypothetical protein [Periweissella cryptocerci]QBO35804.1 hypothetical protein EQG49_04650 [Periweissella cryptocerci]